MPYLRQRPRIPATGRASIRLSPAQRDLFLAARDLPKDVGHLLHRATVRQGKLMIRVDRADLTALIAAAAAIPPRAGSADRSVSALLRYLESIDDRFEEPEVESDDESAGDPAE